jgi:hypothetical protein
MKQLSHPKLKLDALAEALLPLYTRLFPGLTTYLKKELAECNSVLDLGCGHNSPLQHCRVPFSVGIELFDPYLEESKKKGIHNQYVKADIRKVEFKPKSFDAVVALDVLEHLTKQEGAELLHKMEIWARKKALIFTTNGYLWQNGYDDNPLQEHRSGWTASELKELGYKVYGINGWKGLRGYRASMKYKPSFLWARISDLTQIATYRCPNKAFQLLAIKEMKAQGK